MQETHKPLFRPLARDDTPQSGEDKYELVKLPDQRWWERGNDLVLEPDNKRDLIRYGQYRLNWGATDGTSGLLIANGPPGTGKSVSVRWAASALMRMHSLTGNGLVIHVPALFDQHLGNSARRVAALLEDIKLSARRFPTFVLLDDAEALFLSRQQSIASNDPTDVVRVATTLFQGLDALRFEPVILYATLNIQGLIDEAIESRCDYILTFGLPTYEARLAILQTKVKGSAGERVLNELATATEGWSGRDLNKITLKAFLKGTATTREELTEEDYLRAVSLTPGSEFTQALQESMNTEVKEEEPCKRLSTKKFQAGASPRKRRWSFAWRRYEPQPTS